MRRLDISAKLWRRLVAQVELPEPLEEPEEEEAAPVEEEDHFEEPPPPPTSQPVPVPEGFFAITCPAGVGPGTVLQVASPSGTVLQVAVPGGVGPGMQFFVRDQPPPPPRPPSPPPQPRVRRRPPTPEASTEEEEDSEEEDGIFLFRTSRDGHIKDEECKSTKRARKKFRKKKNKGQSCVWTKDGEVVKTCGDDKAVTFLIGCAFGQEKCGLGPLEDSGDDLRGGRAVVTTTRVAAAPRLGTTRVAAAKRGSGDADRPRRRRRRGTGRGSFRGDGGGSRRGSFRGDGVAAARTACRPRAGASSSRTRTRRTSRATRATMATTTSGTF